MSILYHADHSLPNLVDSNDMFELSHRLIGIYKTSNATRSKQSASTTKRNPLNNFDRHLDQQPRTYCHSRQHHSCINYITAWFHLSLYSRVVCPCTKCWCRKKSQYWFTISSCLKNVTWPLSLMKWPVLVSSQPRLPVYLRLLLHISHPPTHRDACRIAFENHPSRVRVKGTSMASTTPLQGVEAYTFDVFGTVVDWLNTGVKTLKGMVESSQPGVKITDDGR